MAWNYNAIWLLKYKMKIESKWFTYEELTHTDKNVDNSPNEKQVANLQKLVTNVLDPLREMYGKPININSGFRSAEVNKLVGGVSTSGHLLGTSADLDCNCNKELYNLIKEHFQFRQLINEFGFKWVHVEFREGDNKKQLIKT